MKHAWDNYVRYAWGSHELAPISKKAHTNDLVAKGVTVVDALDTLYIMGMTEEFEKGKKWVRENLDMRQLSGNKFVSVFETNIRFVGGLLTAYAFTGDELFKQKAVHIVNKLLPAFETTTGIPYALVNMKTGQTKNYGSSDYCTLSEFGTLHMEFAYLSDITGSSIYRTKVEKIRRTVRKLERSKKLYYKKLDLETGKGGRQFASLGAGGDSFYEYLLKEWLRSGKKDVEVDLSLAILNCFIYSPIAG